MPNTIPAAGGAMPQTEDERRLDGLRGLEDPIYSLCSMANIMAELLDGCLTGVNQSKNGEHITISMTSHEMDLISFAWNDVVSRSGALRKAFYEAVYGEEGR